MAQEIQKYQRFVKTPYNFTSRPKLRQILSGIPSWNEDDLLRASKLIEAPKQTDTVETIRKSRIPKGLQLLQVTERDITESYVQPQRLTPRDWQLLLSCARSAIFQQGDVIIQENTFNRFLYRIKSGQVKIVKYAVSLFFFLIVFLLTWSLF